MNLHDELIWLADSGGCTPNGAPGVHDGLAAGDSRASLHGAVLEAAHHEWDDNIALLQKHKPFKNNLEQENQAINLKFETELKVKICFLPSQSFWLRQPGA